MDTITPVEIKNTLIVLHQKIKELNSIKSKLQEAHLYCYLDLGTDDEIKEIIDSVKVSIMNL